MVIPFADDGLREFDDSAPLRYAGAVAPFTRNSVVRVAGQHADEAYRGQQR